MTVNDDQLCPTCLRAMRGVRSARDVFAKLRNVAKSIASRIADIGYRSLESEELKVGKEVLVEVTDVDIRCVGA